MDQLWIKDESRNPTASFKDRASAVVVARAQQTQVEVVVTASTGNAGAALAGMAAAVGQKAVILAPRTAPPAKIAQLLVFGAEVILVDGTYDDAFDLTIQAAQEFGWYCRNTGYNPFTVEGKKSAALEIWEQIIIGEGLAKKGKKLSVFVSVGDGNIISGIHKGFKDLVALGWLGTDCHACTGSRLKDRLQWRMRTIQETKRSSRCLPVHWQIAYLLICPRDGVRAVRAASETGGAYLTVSDGEILSAIAGLGKVGIFAEPAGATSYAGFIKAITTGILSRDDAVVVINTGSGLKDTRAAVKAVPEAKVIEPRLDALKRVIK